MKQEEKRGWVRYIGTVENENVIPKQVYPCIITEHGFIKLPERFGDYHFHPGVMFEIVDPFLININKILE